MLFAFYDLNNECTVWVNPSMVVAVEPGIARGEAVIRVLGWRGYRARGEAEDVAMAIGQAMHLKAEVRG